jgi:hypothetical protein
MDRRRIVFGDYAASQAGRRGLGEAAVCAVVASPEQTEVVRIGREVRQSKVAFPPEGKVYLVRVFVDVSDEEVVVVTAYRTSKIAKYWRQP